MSTATFSKSTASIAAWNLATFEDLSTERIKRQADGLRLLDAEFVTLVEIKNEDHIKEIAAQLSSGQSSFQYTFLPQDPTNGNTNHDAMHIGVLYKEGITVDSPAFIPGSDLDNSGYRKAFTCNVEIGNFSFNLIGVHLKSGRALNAQRIRDRHCNVIGAYIKNLRG